MKEEVATEELKQFLSELKRVADDAEIPEEPYVVDIGAEIKRAVDEALEETSQ